MAVHGFVSAEGRGHDVGSGSGLLSVAPWSSPFTSQGTVAFFKGSVKIMQLRVGWRASRQLTLRWRDGRD